ncbi:ABC transporter ATP-binding protein [Gordonia jinhuaensis]|uniref:ABC transporter n=1 Tax=Gordonia jinhuaensis TaxID=1517702 RepID=A0A916STW3_9ACTN|nr:ABC transporter ATP-binding protein [Gordonia jinhuaensis]GGB16282.1 ABC transporter [Gordonia jinhuaensis]
MSTGWISTLAADCLSHRKLVTITMAVTLVGVGIEVVAPLLTKAAVDVATGDATHRMTIATIVTILVVLAVVRYACQYARRLNAGQLSLEVQNDLRVRLLHTVLGLDGRSADTVRTGQVVSRSISDLQMIQGLLAMVPLSLGALVQVVLALGIMLYLSPLLTLIALLNVPAVALVVWHNRRKLFAATWSAQQQASDLAQHVEETVTGVRVVKGFGQERREVDTLDGHGRRLYSLRMRAARVNARFAPTMSSIPQLGTIAIIALGGYLTLHHHITVGTFLAFATYVATMTSLARLLTNLVVSGQLARAAVERVYEVIDYPTDPGLERTGTLPNGPVGVRLTDVHFSYGYSPDGYESTGVSDPVVDEARAREGGAPHTDSTPAVLAGFDLTVAPGECVAIVGGPGSGKSTIASLIARLYRPDSGSISLIAGDSDHPLDDMPLDDVAVDQLYSALTVVYDEPFLYSASIASNIDLVDDDVAPAMPRIADSARRAAAAEFIDALPHGYDTVVGERGLTLSGGQRQRIALARALFADPRLLILDDATSAVDAVTEVAILDELRARNRDRVGRTMIVIAHRRSTLALADRVAVLDHGRVADIGTVDELDARCELFRSLMSYEPADFDPVSAADLDRTPDREGTLQIAAAENPECENPECENPETKNREGDSTGPASRTASTVDLWPDADELPTPTRDRPSAPAPTAGRGGRGGGMSSALGSMPASRELLDEVAALPPADEQAPASIDSARTDDGPFSLRGLLRSVRWLLIAAVIAIAIDTLSGLVYPSVARVAVNAATDGHAGSMWTACLWGLAFVALGWFAAAAMTMTSSRGGERILLYLRIRTYAHLQRLGLDFYERELSGRIMTRMTTDVDALSTFLQTGLSQAVVAVLTILGVAVALLLTDLTLGLSMLAVFPPLIVATIIFRRISSVAYARSREIVSGVNADFQENIGGLRTTRIYRHTQIAERRFGRRARDYVRARMTSQRAISVYFPFITFVSDLATAGVIALGAHQVATGSTGPGTLVAFVLYLAMLFGPVQQLSQVFDGYQQAAVGLRRIGELLRTPSSLDIATGDERLERPDRFRGDAALREVSFRYSGAATDALSQVNLHIPAGSSLALVGRTGAGKSTIVKLLARFYDPTTGEVTMDGTDVRRFGLLDYRARLGVVPQEAHLFTGTVATNIAYGRPDAPREDIEAAATAVGALEMIAALPGAMNQPVGERGQGLSAGQRQLIALARAQLVDPDLLLLDEATATLDPATERRVLSAGAQLASHRTSVLVAHRLATAARADQIAVVDAGRIVELGTHRELIALKGRYRDLWVAGTSPAVDVVDSSSRPV